MDEVDAVGAEILETNQRLRKSLLAIRNGVRLMSEEIAARKRAREERETSKTHSSPDQKLARIEDSEQNRSPSILLK